MLSRRSLLAGLGTTTVFATTTVTIGKTKAFIPLIAKSNAHSFWRAVRDGAMQSGVDQGADVTFKSPTNEGQIRVQAELLAAIFSQNPSAVGLAALDELTLIPLLRDFEAAGIPIIAFDSGVQSDIPVTTCATDNLAAAARAADEMAALVNGTGKIAIISHDAASQTGIDRVAGFKERAAKTHPGLEIVATQYGGGDHLISEQITLSILKAYPDLQAIFAANEGTVIGVLNAIEKHTSKVSIIGYDSGQQQRAAVRSGLVAGAISQNPYRIGYETVAAAIRAIQKQDLPKRIDTGFAYYTASNMDSPEISAMLYD
ncbi:MAG: ABC transporter substrate-binding protein [Roseobacter sp.]